MGGGGGIGADEDAACSYDSEDEEGVGNLVRLLVGGYCCDGDGDKIMYVTEGLDEYAIAFLNS